MLLSTAYLPPVQYFCKLLSSDAEVEQCESFVKQTYRNRCVIDSPQGALTLTVPVEKPSDNNRLIRDLRISDHGNWRHQHWQALTSSYYNSPFFEYYQDDFRPFYEQRYDFLVDFNEALTQKCIELIDISVTLQRSSNYTPKDTKSIGENDDFRDLISPKHSFSDDHTFFPVPYYQVFADRHGFLPNLSIVDLLFNMGPESIFVLQQSTK